MPHVLSCNDGDETWIDDNRLKDVIGARNTARYTFLGSLKNGKNST